MRVLRVAGGGLDLGHPKFPTTHATQPATNKNKTPPAIANGACKSGFLLTLTILETFAGARLPVFLALAHARIAGEQAVGLERRTQIGIGEQQSAGYPVPHRAGLAVGADAA